MSRDDATVDDELLRRFESHRIAGGTDMLESFLVGASSETAEELVAVDLEFRWKWWSADGARAAEAPELSSYEAVLAGGDDDLRRRLEAEQRRLRARFAPRFHPLAGARLAHYVLRERVGRGAFAEVWRALDERLGRDVAVKLARPELAGDAEVLARLVREARSAARLRHPSIVPVHEVGEADGQPFIVSDFVAGETLAEAMRARRFDAGDAARIVLQLAEALDYAHSCGVVHRDVKPANVLLDGAGRPLLADFGLAQLRAAESVLTRHGEVVGTPAYMAPEQARGDGKEADARSDVYSLGVVLYELLTGAVPFERGSAESLLYAVVHEEPRAPREMTSRVPANLDTICLRAMAKAPSRRYPTAGAFAEDLRRFVEGRPILARRVGPGERLLLWTRRNPALAGTIAASVAALLLVGGLGLSRVLEERRRFREERDRANAHLYRSLVTEARSLLAAHESEWRSKAMAALREAAALDVPGRDTAALRDLVLACEGSLFPSMERVARWPAEGGTATALAASRDGAFVAAVTDRGVVWVRDAGGRVLATTRPSLPPTRLAFAEARRLVVGMEDGTVGLFDASDLASRGEVRGAGGAVQALAVAPAGDIAAVAFSSGAVRFLRLDGVWLRPTAWDEGRSPDGDAFALAFSSDGGRLAVGGADGGVRVWDVAERREVARWQASDPPRAAAFSPSGDRIAWCMHETGGWGLGKFASPSAVETWPGIHLAAARSVEFLDDTWLLTASSDGTLRVTTVSRRAVAVARDASIMAAVVLPGTRRVVAALAEDGVAVWEIAEPASRREFATNHVARFRPSTGHLFTGTVDYDMGDGARTSMGSVSMPSDAHRSNVWGVAASPDGQFVASSSHEGDVKLWDAQSHALVRDLRRGPGLAWCVAFAPDSRSVAVCVDSNVVVLDVADGREMARFDGGETAARCATYHPTSRLLATTWSDGSLRLGDPGEMAGARVLFKAPAALHEAAFSRDGATLAVASGDGSVLVWTGASFAEAAPRPPDRRIDAGGGAAWAVGFDLQGRYIATGTERGAVVLRDARTFDVVANLASDVHAVRSLAFDDTGRFLAAGCYAGASVVWDLPALRAVLAPLGLDWNYDRRSSSAASDGR